MTAAGQDLHLPPAARRLLGLAADDESAGFAAVLGPPLDSANDPADLTDVAALDPWIMARLLEDGDRDDLAWLAACLGEASLAAWLELQGARRLSRRSLAFWAVLLDRPRCRPERLPALAHRRELWPL